MNIDTFLSAVRSVVYMKFRLFLNDSVFSAIHYMVIKVVFCCIEGTQAWLTTSTAKAVTFAVLHFSAPMYALDILLCLLLLCVYFAARI